MMDGPSFRVQDNADTRRYEIFVDGDLAGYSAYRDDEGTRVFTHTTVDPDYAGGGVGSALAKGALDDVRSRGMNVLPRCPFIASYIARHGEYADLVRQN